MVVEHAFTVRGRGLCVVVRLDRVPELGDMLRHVQSGAAVKVRGIERNAQPLEPGSVTALCLGDVIVEAGDELTWVQG